MNEKGELRCIRAYLQARQLERLYETLSEEETAYELVVKKSQNHHRAVALYCEADRVGYFKQLMLYENENGQDGHDTR